MIDVFGFRIAMHSVSLGAPEAHRQANREYN